MAQPAQPAAPRARQAKQRSSLKGLTLLAYDPKTGTIVQVAPEAVREVLAAPPGPVPPPVPIKPDPSDDVPLASKSGAALTTKSGARLVGDIR